MNTIEKLDAIAEYESQLDVLYAAKQQLVYEATPQHVRDRLAEIEVEFSGKTEAVTENVAKLKEEVQAEILAAGETVKGKFYMAVWNKGRVSWDSKKLDGMSSIIPALNDAKKEGEPTVAFRRVQ